jgi:hypothetical protein
MDEQYQERMDQLRARHDELMNSLPGMDDDEAMEATLAQLEEAYKSIITPQKAVEPTPLPDSPATQMPSQEMPDGQRLPIPDVSKLEASQGTPTHSGAKAKSHQPAFDSGPVPEPPPPQADPYAAPRYSQWMKGEGVKGVQLDDAVPMQQYGEKDPESDDIRTLEEIGHAAREYHTKLIGCLTTIRDVLIEGIGDLESVQAYFQRMR